MENNPRDTSFWSNQLNTPRINSWFGLAFERVCMMHVQQIKKALGISGILSDTHSWSCGEDHNKGTAGSQIDMIIARKDQVVNICEMKYSEFEFTANEKTVMDIKKKISDFTISTATRCAVHPVLVTTYGLTQNAYASEFQAVITMADLFE